MGNSVSIKGSNPSSGKNSINSASKNTAVSVEKAKSNIETLKKKLKAFTKIKGFKKNEVFVERDGRRYQSKAPYLLPNDMEEVDRLDQQHYFLRHIRKGNYSSQLDPEQQEIIDIGTGTGIWAMEIAAEFPNAHVIGMDVSPVQPNSIVPGNCEFQTLNVLDGLPFKDSRFDFLHARLLIVGIPTEKWPDVVKDYYRVIKPGGNIELIETDGVFFNTGKYGVLLTKFLTEGCKRLGFDTLMSHRLAPLLKKTGFIDIEEEIIELPFGKHAGYLGSLNAQSLAAVAQGIKPAMLQAGVATEEEYDEMVNGIAPEADEHESYFIFKAYTAKKPL